MALAGRQPDRAWVDHVVDTVDLRRRLDHRPAELSGGQQQRVAVARALDSLSSADILTFMRRAADEFGQTIVMVTHDPGAASFAHYVLFLADGRIVGEMPSPDADAVLDRIKGLDRVHRR